ncbi:hypothetical protein YC2023_084828 [Brassica napus]
MIARAMIEGVAVWCSQYKSDPNLVASEKDVDGGRRGSKMTINFVVCCIQVIQSVFVFFLRKGLHIIKSVNFFYSSQH